MHMGVCAMVVGCTHKYVYELCVCVSKLCICIWSGVCIDK